MSLRAGRLRSPTDWIEIEMELRVRLCLSVYSVKRKTELLNLLFILRH